MQRVRVCQCVYLRVETRETMCECVRVRAFCYFGASARMRPYLFLCKCVLLHVGRVPMNRALYSVYV